MLLPFLDFLAESYGPFRVFNYFTFRAILSTLTSLIFCLTFGKFFISFLKRKNFVQIIREVGPEKHLEKRVHQPWGLINFGGNTFFMFMLGGFK